MTSTMSYTPGTLAAHDFIPGELLQNSLLSHPKCWQAEWWLFPLTLSAPCGWSRGAGTARLLGSRLGELGGNGWDLSLSGAGTVHFRSARDLRFAGKGWRKLTVGHGKGLAMHGEKHMHRKPAIKWNQVTKFRETIKWRGTWQHWYCCRARTHHSLQLHECASSIQTWLFRQHHWTC